MVVALLATRPSVTTRGRSQRLANVALPVSAILLAVAAQEAVTRTGLVNPDDIPPASAVFGVVLGELAGGQAWLAIGQTLWSSVLGLGLAAIIAVPLGIILGTSRVLHHGTRLIVEFLRPIPPITIVPLAILLFGTALEMKLMLVVFGCVWPLLIQTMYGVKDVDPVLDDAARICRMTRLQRFRQLVLPAASPYIATGLRLSATFAVGLSVVAELIGGAPGLGQMIYQAQLGGQRGLMFAVVILAAGLGMAVELTFRSVEGRLLHWHESYRGGDGA